MKRILAIFLLAIFLTLPVLAGWEEEANNQKVNYTIGKAESAPVLGQFDTSKYTKLDVQPGDLSYAWNDSFDDAEAWARAQTFEAYVSYDANNVYTLIIADAKHYFNDLDDGDGNCWQYSCIQVSASAATDEGGDRLEYGIYRNSVNGSLGSVIWAQHGDAKAEYEAVAGKNYTVDLKDGKLYYETIIPVNTFLNKDKIAEGEKIGWNIVIAQTDPDAQGHIHTQIASGCTGNGKTAENFAKLTLGPAIAPPVVEVAPEPEPEPEAPVAAVEEAPVAVVTPAVVAPPPSSAAQTGDAGMITFAIIMLIGATCLVILRRKIAVK